MEDDLYEKASAEAAAENRTLSGQIVPWVRAGQAALENPDLPADFIAEALTSLGEPHCDAMPFVPRTPNQHTSFSDEGAPYMAAVRFKIPDEVEDAFNAAYAGQDKNAVITELMREAIERAMDLSIRLRHHLFDTLYHAAALRTADATLVTADHTYYDKAQDEGRIVPLSEFDVSLST